MKLGRYKHYKGNFYDVVGIARHTENPSDKFVVYRALYTDKEFGKNALWVKQLKIFKESVTFNGKKVPRFTYVGNDT